MTVYERLLMSELPAALPFREFLDSASFSFVLFFSFRFISLLLGQFCTGRILFSGQHYWYNVTSDMSCEDFWPMFLLYNGGELNAFGWAFQGDLNSPRYEKPTPDVLGVTNTFGK